LQRTASKPFQAVGIKLLKKKKYVGACRELDVVKQERDILKKAIGIFSRPQP